MFYFFSCGYKKYQDREKKNGRNDLDFVSLKE